MTPLGTIVPSANWVVEATTVALLRDVSGVVPVFSRTPVPDGVPDAHDLPNMLRAAELRGDAATADEARALLAKGWFGSEPPPVDRL